MANTFLAAQGIDVKASLCEHDLGDTARDILAKAETAGCQVLLPRDVVVAEEFKAMAPCKTVPATEVPDGHMILDVGTDTIADLAARFEAAKTVVWNGPLGAFEIAPFDNGTNAAAIDALAATYLNNALNYVGSQLYSMTFWEDNSINAGLLPTLPSDTVFQNLVSATPLPDPGPSPVPVPAAAPLMAVAIGSLVAVRRRKQG